MGSSDALNLVETGLGLGVSLLFTGMALKMTSDMTNNLIGTTKKRGVNFFGSDLPAPQRRAAKNIKKHK